MKKRVLSLVMAKLLPEGAAAQDFTVRSVSDPEIP